MKLIFFTLLLIKQIFTIYQNEEILDYNNFLWGTYKPQLIQAVSQKKSDHNPFTIGLGYMDAQNCNTNNTIRYRFPDRTSNEVLYNFLQHDGQNIAYHTVNDPQLKTKMDSYFIKQSSTDTEQSWIYQTQGNIQPVQLDFLSVYYVFSIEQFNYEVNDNRYLNFDRKTLTVTLNLDNGYKEYVTIQQKGDPYINMAVKPYFTDRQNNWNVTEFLYETFNQECQEPEYSGNNYCILKNEEVPQKDTTLLIIQFIFQKNSEFELQLQYSSLKPQLEYNNNWSKLYDQKLQQFNQNYQMSFFPQIEQPQQLEYYKCGQQAFSELLGGLSVSFGNMTCVQKDPNCLAYLPMFSHTPSRFRFPRPFLWDEGFHDLITCYYNQDICLESLKTWFGTINMDGGWIPREQARGPENQYYLFRIYPDWAMSNTESNPPSIIYSVYELFKWSVPGDKIRQTLKQIWPAVKENFENFYQQQGVKIDGYHTNLFKWWGPIPQINLGSGMDDFPRSDGEFISKYNIDCSCWAYFFAKTLSEMAEVFQPSVVIYYNNLANQIKENIYEQLLDPTDLIFKDLLTYKGQTKFSPHYGYINAFPFIFNMINPDTQKDLFLNQLNFYSNKETLWSPYGIRSLSKQDPFYGSKDHGHNYWRGSIWINLNYMILGSLKNNYWQFKETQDFYTALRQNIIKEVCDTREIQGYFFEDFDANQDGLGNDNAPFNGWTSLVTLIIAEQYNII